MNLLLGDKFESFVFGEFSVSLGLANSVFAVGCDWLLTGPDGTVLDQRLELSHRQDWKLWILIGKVISHVSISDEPPVVLAISTTDGYTLKVLSSLSVHEDWSILALHGGPFFVCDGEL